MRKNVMAGILALSAGLTLTACGQESTKTEAPKPKGKPSVCLVMKSLANEYFQEMQKGAVAHVAKRNDLTLESSGIQNETDVDGQVALVESCITKRASAIVVAPADSKALVRVVKKATDAGIKVVNIDVKLDEAALKQENLTTPFVGPDNREGAKLAGLAMAKGLPKGAGCVILEGNPGADNATQRSNGFKDAIQEVGLTLIKAQTARWETDEANQVFNSIYTANPDKIKCLMSSNDNMTLGALKVIEARKADIKVASFDNIPAIKPYLENGKVTSTLDQFGSQQAGFGIDAAMKMIAGETLTGWQKTEIKVITKDNVG